MTSFFEQFADVFLKLNWGILSFFASNELISYATLLGGLVSAVIALRLWKGFSWRKVTQRLVPRRIRTSPSARLDFFYYLLIQPIVILILAPCLLILFQYSSGELVSLYENWLGPRSSTAQDANGAFAYFAYTLLVFIAIDFAFFISHYLQHKWRWLWCFHKVHHSATVLVPFTALRFHPLDMLWNMAWGAGLSLLMSSLCQYFFYNGEQAIELLGNNLFVALSYLTTHNLRHSHIWLHYPHPVSNWLLSPVQHQLHHSVKPEHWDRNFGYLFAGWDRLFGTLVNPHRFERIKVGVMENDGFYNKHDSISSMLITPFREAKQVLFPSKTTAKPKKHPSS